MPDSESVLFSYAFFQFLKPDCPSSSQEPARNRHICFSTRVISVFAFSTKLWSLEEPVRRRAVPSSSSKRLRSNARPGASRDQLFPEFTRIIRSGICRCTSHDRRIANVCLKFLEKSEPYSQRDLRAFLRFSRDPTFHMWGPDSAACHLLPDPASAACGHEGRTRYRL